MVKTLRTILIAATLGAFSASAGAATIHVLRGSDSETVDTGRTGPVAVRGGVFRAAQPMTKSRARSPAQLTAGGSVLWLIEPNSGRLIACSLRGSSIAGQSKIHCTAGPSR